MMPGDNLGVSNSSSTAISSLLERGPRRLCTEEVLDFTEGLRCGGGIEILALSELTVAGTGSACRLFLLDMNLILEADERS